MSVVSLGIQYFPDPTTGRPVFNGKIYVGIPDTDPIIPQNQKSVFLLQETGVEVPVSQPVLTGVGGIPMYNNAPAQIIVDGDYSLTVLNSRDEQVYYLPSSAAILGPGGSGLLITETVNLTAGQTVVSFSSALNYASFYLGGPDVDRGRLVKNVDYTVDWASNTVTLTDSAPAGSTLTAAYNDAGSGSETTFVSTYDSIDELRGALTFVGATATLKGYYTPGDGGGGPLRVWKTDGPYVDNGGSIIVPTGGDGSGAWVWAPTGFINASSRENSPSYRLGLQYGDIDATVRGAYLFDGFSGFPNYIGINNVAPVTGGRAPDTGYVTAGIANVSAVLAGYDNIVNDVAGIVASQHSIVYAGADHATIMGGSIHGVEGGSYAGIFAGSLNTIEDGCSYAVIIGGDQNTCEEGIDVTTSGFRSVILGGSGNVAGGRNAFIATGSAVRVDSPFGCVLAGDSVQLTAGQHMVAAGVNINMGVTQASDYSVAIGNDVNVDGSRSWAHGDGVTINTGANYSSAVGFRTTSPFTGAHVHSARQRGGTKGNNQALTFTASQETTSATGTFLSITGTATFSTMPINSIVTGIAQVTGVDTATGNVAVYQINFTMKRDAGDTPTIVHQASTTIVDTITGLSQANPLIFGTTAGRYRMNVGGKADTTIAWNMVFNGHQIVWG